MSYLLLLLSFFFFFFQAEDGIRDLYVTGVQTCALPICPPRARADQGADPVDLSEPRVPRAWRVRRRGGCRDLLRQGGRGPDDRRVRSEEHTSELQSRRDLVCRLLLEKKKKNNKKDHIIA